MDKNVNYQGPLGSIPYEILIKQSIMFVCRGIPLQIAIWTDLDRSGPIWTFWNIKILRVQIWTCPDRDLDHSPLGQSYRRLQLCGRQSPSSVLSANHMYKLIFHEKEKKICIANLKKNPLLLPLM